LTDRRIAAALSPPTQRGIEDCAPHACCSVARYSSVSRPRLANGTPSASNSCRDQPTPTPSTSRPPLSSSSAIARYQSGRSEGGQLAPPRSSASVSRPAARGGTSRPGRRRTRRAARTACARAAPRGRRLPRPARPRPRCRRRVRTAAPRAPRPPMTRCPAAAWSRRCATRRGDRRRTAPEARPRRTPWPGAHPAPPSSGCDVALTQPRPAPAA